jgi:DNA-binding NarL/FixJ family response regulator
VPVRVVVEATEPPAGWAALRPRSCPCCVGRVQMQVELARLLRERRPRGVLIELADASHLPAVRRALAAWPLSDYVAL